MIPIPSGPVSDNVKIFQSYSSTGHCARSGILQWNSLQPNVFFLFIYLKVSHKSKSSSKVLSTLNGLETVSEYFQPHVQSLFHRYGMVKYRDSSLPDMKIECCNNKLEMSYKELRTPRKINSSEKSSSECLLLGNDMLEIMNHLQ